MTTVLTKAEALEMQLMRGRMQEISERVLKQGLASSDTQWGAMSHGRVLASLDVADRSLFNVLNILASYLHCTEADQTLRAANWPRTGTDDA